MKTKVLIFRIALYILIGLAIIWLNSFNEGSLSTFEIILIGMVSGFAFIIPDIVLNKWNKKQEKDFESKRS